MYSIIFAPNFCPLVGGFIRTLNFNILINWLTVNCILVEPGNEMYGYYFCRRCTYGCMSVEKKLNMIVHVTS